MAKRPARGRRGGSARKAASGRGGGRGRTGPAGPRPAGQDWLAGALAASDARALLQSVFDAIGNPLFLKDRHSRWALCNPATLGVVGRSYPEVLGKTDLEIYDDRRVAEALIENDRRVMASGEAQVLEEEVTTAQGHRTFRSTKVPLRDGSGEVVGLIGHAQDVTSHRREEELQALQSAVAHLPIGTMVLEVPAQGTPVIVAANQAFQRMTGARPGERVTDRLQIFRIGEADPMTPEQFPGVLAARGGEVVHDVQVRLRRTDGTERLASVSASPMPGADTLGRRRAIMVFLDITEQARDRDALKASEVRYRTLVDQLPVGLTEAGPDGRNRYANRACLELLQRSENDLRGDAWVNLIHPEDQRRVVEGWAQAVGAGVTYRAEYRLVRADGSSRVVDGFGAPLGARGAAPSGYLGVIRDITEERAANAAQREAASKLEAALESMTDAVFISDTEGRFVDFNQAFATVHRFPSKADCARTLAEYPEFLEVSFPDGSVAPLEQWAVPRALRGETATNVEYHLRRLDTGERWVGSYSFAPIQRDGAIVGAVVVGRDISQAKQAEAALVASEARFRDVAAAAGQFVYEIDAHGQLSYISEGVEGLLGYRPAELRGRAWRSLQHGVEQEPPVEAVISEGRRYVQVERTFVHRDGRPVRMAVSGSPMRDAGGQVTGYRGAAMDVTRRFQAEAARAQLQEQLSQSQKMEVVGRLAGGVAHDFNNLLTIILTCAEELKEAVGKGGGLDPEHVEDILGAGKRAAELTRQLLTFARKEVFTPEVVDLNQLVRQTRKLLGRVIGEDVRVVERLELALWPVRCDPGLLGQVLMNLAVNARDAMPRGGQLFLGTANVRFAPGQVPDPEMAPGDYVALSVRDTGVGMSPQVQAHLFEPFFTTKGPGAGTGLGLATAYGIIKQSAGFVTVRSAEGQGSTFEVFLPAHHGQEVAQAAPVALPRFTGTETILLVEDEARVREVSARALRAAGYRVLAVGTDREALTLAKELPEAVHLLLSDVVMPGLGGPELARQVAALRPGIKVLFVSGYAREALLAKGAAVEGSQLLNKPFTPAALLARVRGILDAPRPSAPGAGG